MRYGAKAVKECNRNTWNSEEYGMVCLPERITMKFKTFGNRNDPAVLYFHAMGVTGESSEPVANYVQDRYFCILTTSTVYCKGQKYCSQAEQFL